MKLKIERGLSALAAVELAPAEGILVAAGALLSAEGLEAPEPASCGRELWAARQAPATLLLAPPLPGDIAALTLRDGKGFYVQRGAYLAASPEIRLIEAGGALRGGPFWRAEGEGVLLVSGFGTLEALPVEGRARVGLEHLVAFASELAPTLARLGGAWAELFSPEIVCTLEGEGAVLLQARRPKSFGERLGLRRVL